MTRVRLLAALLLACTVLSACKQEGGSIGMPDTPKVDAAGVAATVDALGGIWRDAASDRLVYVLPDGKGDLRLLVGATDVPVTVESVDQARAAVNLAVDSSNPSDSGVWTLALDGEKRQLLNLTLGDGRQLRLTLVRTPSQRDLAWASGREIVRLKAGDPGPFDEMEGDSAAEAEASALQAEAEAAAAAASAAMAAAETSEESGQRASAASQDGTAEALAHGDAAFHTSFNCGGDLKRAERIVCGHETLAAQDRELSAAYRELLSQLESEPAAATELRTEQMRWLREVRDGCASVTCLRGAYEARLGELDFEG